MSTDKKRSATPAAEPSILFEISQILDSSLDLRTVVEPVLEVITRSLEMKFATLTLLNRATGEISIESAYGLSASQKKKGRYKLGEGITGKVIQTGKAAIVPGSPRSPRSWTRPARARPTKKGTSHFSACPSSWDGKWWGHSAPTASPRRRMPCRRTCACCPSSPR